MYLKSFMTSGLLACLLLLAPLAPAQADTSCTLGPETLPAGSTTTFFNVPSVPMGGSCDTHALQRQCKGGKLSGDKAFRYGSCTVIQPFAGVNTNRRPDQLDPELIALTGARWVRTMADVLLYKEQDEGISNNTKMQFGDWQNYIAAAAGDQKNAILTLKWDFSPRNMHPPRPGSAEEAELFAYLDRKILDPLAASANIIVSGNEPFPDTMNADWSPKEAYGGIPLVVFYQRVTAHIDDYLIAHGLRDQVKLYVGSFTRLHTVDMQQNAAAVQLLTFAEAAPFVDGIDLHTHVSTVNQIDKALKFARSKTQKPVIITEYTYVWKMKSELEGGDTLGASFGKRWGYDPATPSIDYLACDVFHHAKGCRNNPVISKAEWDDFFATRPWVIDHFLLEANRVFRENGVYGSTYGLVQDEPTGPMLRPDGMPWYLGFLFSEAALGDGPDGLPYPNYQALEDFRKLPH